MKNSAKQTLLTVFCIILVFIPTYIAIAYFAVDSHEKSQNQYDVIMTDNNGNEINLFNQDTDEIAESLIEINSKLTRAAGIDPNSLQTKYYDITVKKETVLFTYRYYFSTDSSKKTVVLDKNGDYYTLEFKDVKSFLSKSYAYKFYDYSTLPKLSIYGGSDVIPVKADWKYKTVSGSFINSGNISLAQDMESYSMTGKTKLQFDVAPDECIVKVYSEGEEIHRGNNLESIPYQRLDSESLSFKIEARWTKSTDYRGSATYQFYSYVGKAPEFLVSKNTIKSGEFFAVSGFNVTAPEKIEFSSVPNIDFKPVFFPDGDIVCALIPIDKDYPSPCEYTFTFKYGDSESTIKVKVEERDIYERNYDTSNIGVLRTDSALNEYYALLTEIGMKYEKTRYFNDIFMDYEKHFSKETAKIKLGFGHKYKPTNKITPFRLDGVDYMMSEGINIPAICAGKVVYVGSSQLLGNFVVIDHGFGLKTWYCHLSEASVITGVTVTKGQTVGKAGHSGYTNSNGVYLITTIQNIPVSPYPLQEKEIIFKR